MAETKYTHDDILRVLACKCRAFSKTDILQIAKRVGKAMKNTTSFITKYLNEDVIYKANVPNGTTEYLIVPKAWTELMQAITPEEFNMIKKHFGQSESMNFSQAVNAFTHGQEYSLELQEATLYIFPSQQRLYLSQLILHMTSIESMFPFLKKLDSFYLEELFGHFAEKICALDFSDKDLQTINELIVNNPSVIDARKIIMNDMIAFHHTFIKQGNAEKARKDSDGGQTFYSVCLQAFQQLQQGKFDAAAKLFLNSLKGTGCKEFSDPIINFYYGISLANSTLPAAQTRISALFKTALFGIESTVALKMLLLIAKGRLKEINPYTYLQSCHNLPQKAMAILVLKHFNIKTPLEFESILDEIDSKGIRLLQMEMAADIARYSPKREELEKETGLHPTLPTYVKRLEWDIKLDNLILLNEKNTKGKGIGKAGSFARVVYLVSPQAFTIQPKLQKSKDGINWSSGRNIALEKFMKGIAEGMTEEDKIVGTCVNTYSYGWYGETTFELSGGKAMAALIGNPLVFNSVTGACIDVVEEKPQITVNLSDETYKVKTNVNTSQVNNGYYLAFDGVQKIKVIKVGTNMKKTIDTLQETTFPKTAKDKLTKLLELLSSNMVVMSDLLKGNENIASQQSHSETIVQLQPIGKGIRCQLLVRPFGKIPPACTPGKGMQVITTTIDGKQVQTKRNLKRERENYNQIEQLMVDFEEDDYEGKSWQLTPEECLKLLEQLLGMKEQCKVEWPEGERLKIARGILSPKDFNISVNSVANWFELSGDIQISSDKKMNIADFMEKLSQSKGNFIQLTDNEYVRITAELRRHIDQLERIATHNRGKMRISQFNAPMLEELGNNGIEMKTDKAFDNLISRINDAQTAETKIPKTINADLRSYQKEGYQWMSRLALWGAGALLADDMGLGKTLQAITLLLSRAKQGAQLVVVPTSLILNWRDEMTRFAPSLNIKILNKQGEERKTIIENAKEFDVVVTTYGLLINEEELLIAKKWRTIVLDEAHTIKNRETKMSQVAMKLNGDFRLLLTGTPLQNHVSEIWNLMQFANPDLLGSYKDFTDRFLLPIEHNHDKDRQRQLKRIITPFILRRTKSDVLSELPKKTEITLKVDLSEEEWAFYDNIRQKALANIENSTSTAIQALAEITRLRQAACNARLVEKDIDIPSSKLESFMQLVDELHTNHHRALVFSQFTSHLALVKQQLDKAGLAYLYLDGSTSANERIHLVEAFQQGDMPLFLISLKAGGLGLNLTAADYVIHLDPWWNPAIEDQASDRTYRIGQQKPVTIYRLIAAGTIEEKILALHQTKKNMADALLEGGDVSANMTRDEMLELLQSAQFMPS